MCGMLSSKHAVERASVAAIGRAPTVRKPRFASMVQELVMTHTEQTCLLLHKVQVLPELLHTSCARLRRLSLCGAHDERAGTLPRSAKSTVKVTHTFKKGGRRVVALRNWTCS